MAQFEIKTKLTSRLYAEKSEARMTDDLESAFRNAGLLVTVSIKLISKNDLILAHIIVKPLKPYPPSEIQSVIKLMYN